MMKGPVTTNSYGIVSRIDNSPNKHMRKKINADTKVKSVRASERRETLRSLARQRKKAFDWLRREVKNNSSAQLPSVQCPICRKQVYLCKTPMNAIAWSDTPSSPWVSHPCAVDLRYPNASFTDTELAQHKVLTSSYLNLRAEIDAKENR